MAMPASADAETKEVGATAVRFDEDVVLVSLTDGREVAVPLARVPWLAWLLQASPEQRLRWSIEPGGFAVYWDELDDGFEVAHLLSLQPLG